MGTGSGPGHGSAKYVVEPRRTVGKGGSRKEQTAFLTATKTGSNAEFKMNKYEKIR